MRKLLLTLFVAGATLVGCKKEDTLVKEVTIKAFYSSETANALNKKFLDPVAGIEITLYGSEEDFSKLKNKVASLVTDAKGEVTFKNLEEKEYFFFAKNDICMMNIKDIASKENKVSVKAAEFGSYVLTKIDQVFVIGLSNNLDKSVYVRVDLEGEKQLLKKGGYEEIYLAPEFGSSSLNYLEHTLYFYDTIDDVSPFKIEKVTGNTNCQLIPVYLE